MSEPEQEDLLINSPHVFLQPDQLKPLLQECIRKIHIVREAALRYAKTHNERLSRIKAALISRKRRQLHSEVEALRDKVRRLNNEMRQKAEKSFTAQNAKFNMGLFSFNKPLDHFLNVNGVISEQKILEFGKDIDESVSTVSDSDLEVMLKKAHRYSKQLSLEMFLEEVKEKELASELRYPMPFTNRVKKFLNEIGDKSHMWKATETLSHMTRISEIDPMAFITTKIALDLFPDATAMVPCSLINSANEVRKIYSNVLKIFPNLEEECNYSGSLHDVSISSRIQLQSFSSL